jgi:hypothetical protein
LNNFVFCEISIIDKLSQNHFESGDYQLVRIDEGAVQIEEDGVDHMRISPIDIIANLTANAQMIWKMKRRLIVFASLI